MIKLLKSLPKARLQKVILVAVQALVFTGAIVHFYVMKQLDERATYVAEIDKLQAQLNDAKGAAQFELNNAAVREQMRAFVATQEVRMVEGDSYSWLVREMTLLAEKHPISLSAVQAGRVTPYPGKGQYEGYVAHLDATGTYDQLGHFVSDLENAFPMCLVKNVSVSVIDPAQGDCRVSLDVTLLMKPKASEAGAKKKA